MTAKETEKVTPKEGAGIPIRISLEDVRDQIVAFGDEIQEYLTRVGANVEVSKFSAEKSGDGLEVEVGFKARIKPKPRAEVPK